MQIDNLDESDSTSSLVAAVAEGWALKDPWVSQFPADDLRDRGINLVVTDWNMIDPGKARDWVLSLPVGASQNIAFKSFAESIVYSLSDSFAQEQAMESIMHSWSQSDPAAARNWLAGWSGTDALKTSLESLLVAN